MIVGASSGKRGGRTSPRVPFPAGHGKRTPLDYDMLYGEAANAVCERNGNHKRPHQAFGGTYPGDIYTPSVRIYQPPPDSEYPYHDRTVRVTRCGASASDD